MAAVLKSYCLVSTALTPAVKILRRGRSYRLGRGAESDLVLPFPLISRAHAELVWEESGGFRLRDLGSKNGTQVNDSPVADRRLEDGDSVRIGAIVLRYREMAGDIASLLDPEAETDDSTRSIDSRGGRGLAREAALGGRFAGQELLEICKLVALNEHAGELRIRAEGHPPGVLAFWGGEVVAASMGGRIGQDAALAILLLDEGRFELVLGFPDVTGQAINTDTLLMEAARRRDERHTPAPASISTTTAAMNAADLTLGGR